MEWKYKIEKGIEPQTPNQSKYPFSLMVEGDSFFVPLESKGQISNIRSITSRFKRIHQVKYVVEKRTENGVDGARVFHMGSLTHGDINTTTTE